MATFRLIRFITLDELAERLVVMPVISWAQKHLKASCQWLVNGLSCYWCVGFWVALVQVVLFWWCRAWLPLLIVEIALALSWVAAAVLTKTEKSE